MKYKHNSAAKKIALGGIITLLTLSCLYLVSILPTNKIFFFWLSTIFIAFIVIEIGVSTAVLSFFAVSILGFLIIPNKLVLLPYTIYFGYYGVVKYYIEKINNLLLEWVIKIILFNVATYVIFYISNNILFNNIIVKFDIRLFIVVLQIGFLVYDYFYSIMIKYYKFRLRKYL
ncbi:hypothetical protein [Caldisalinibacter kiritimatiensis]|uniref:Putative membrane protein n=1 Tax=Caldisalinibacter kiritimatiensis TaxID=1304284 RepID=R1CXN8_9FIRM|nr:hypothetical protein [Caldisalinibacter kiritimatiensis]EOD01374.1 Putative membrane protein [Caldisalinibacter kiritimatiensis]